MFSVAGGNFMHYGRIFPIFFVLPVLMLAPCHVEADWDDPISLDEVIQEYNSAQSGREKGRAYAHFSTAFNYGYLIMDHDDAETCARFLFQVATDNTRTFMGSGLSPWDLVASYPHPALREVLVEYIATAEPESVDNWAHAQSRALAALVRLNDQRALPYLIAGLSVIDPDYQLAMIRLLGWLGEREALPALHAVAADSSLLAQYIGVFRQRIEASPHYGHGESAQELAGFSFENIHRELAQAVAIIEAGDESELICTYPLSNKAIGVLKDRDFVIVPEIQNELYEFYKSARHRNSQSDSVREYLTITQPFVTTDLLFHTYAIMLRACLEEFETLVLQREIGNLCRDIAAASLEQRQELSDSRLRDLAHQNAAFFAVPAILCHEAELDALDMPQLWHSEVDIELARLAAADKIETSRILGYAEDYREYRPVGRFAGSGNAGYFQAVSWLGRTCFPVKDLDSTDRVLLLLGIMENEPEIRERWLSLDHIYCELFGPRDDPSVIDYERALEAISMGPTYDPVSQALQDPELRDKWHSQLAGLPKPRINTRYILPDQDWKSSTLGFRFLGQRFSYDAAILQAAMDQERVWPVSGMHVAANLLGSKVAKDKYSLADQDFGRRSIGLLEDDGLHVEAVDVLRKLFQPVPDAPKLFHTEAWERKQINCALGGWSELCANNEPYLKCAHNYMGLSGLTRDFYGYVEPYPAFYRSLADVVGRLHEMCAEYGIYAVTDSVVADKVTDREKLRSMPYAKTYDMRLKGIRVDSSLLPDFSRLLMQLASLAERELRGENQTIVDAMLLRTLGNRIRHLSLNHSSSNIAEEPMSRITYVATEYLAGERLAVGVGRPVAIYVAVPHRNHRIVCRGGIYTYYEFVQRCDNPIDSQEWSAATGGDRFKDRGTAARYLTPLQKRPWLAEQGLLDVNMPTPWVK